MDKTGKKRLQLTLFVDDECSKDIEYIRSKYNPQQHALIKGHVTLCREDELDEIELVKANLLQLKTEPIEISFGLPIRFATGNGVLLPATGPNTVFQELRKQVLKGAIDRPRLHEAHITLMHPRNSTCTDSIFQAIEKTALPSVLTFNKISLITQVNDRPWQVLATYELQ